LQRPQRRRPVADNTFPHFAAHASSFTAGVAAAAAGVGVVVAVVAVVVAGVVDAVGASLAGVVARDGAVRQHASFARTRSIALRITSRGAYAWFAIEAQRTFAHAAAFSHPFDSIVNISFTAARAFFNDAGDACLDGDGAVFAGVTTSVMLSLSASEYV
jgi:hypothetical protein